MSRITDFAIYVAIGLACVAAAIALAEFTDLTKREADTLFKWVRFGGLTAIVFVVTVIGRNQFFRRASFWGLLFVIFAVHCVLGVALVARLDDWTIWWTVAVAVIEGAVLDLSLKYLGFPACG